MSADIFLGDSQFDWSKCLCITNRHLCPGTLEDQLERHVLPLRPRAVILREKDLTPAEYSDLLRRVAALCRAADVPLIPHTFVDAALQQGFTAIHLPMPALLQLSPSERQRFTVVGASVHSVDEARAAVAAGATYVTASHIFPTDCKKGLPPRGLPFLRSVCTAVPLPVFALGGVDPANAAACLASGASGVCMMSEFMTLS